MQWWIYALYIILALMQDERTHDAVNIVSQKFAGIIVSNR